MVNVDGDTVDLTANIGTWVAATVAMIALVGIVAPYLALQASLSDRNRAMNAVQDFSGKYVTRGYRLTHGLRVLRRIRVPNLAPSYITNEPEKTPLVPPAAVRGLWTLRGRDYQPFNTGWAKLAELIGAYEVSERESDGVVDLSIPRDGTLEIVNSRTALVVSKHWILLLGLLGRYGDRSDKGVLHRRGIRRESYGERILMRDIKPVFPDDNMRLRKSFWRDRREHQNIDSAASSEESSIRHGRLVHDGGSYDSESLSSDDSDYMYNKMTVRRNAYGEWTVDRRPCPTLYGITGTMQGFGRQKGSWSYLTSMSFVPRSDREMFPPRGPHERRDVASVETLFWLAQGFLPCGVGSDGRQVIISLEDPDSGEDDAAPPISTAEILENISVFELLEADEVPVSIGNALRSLGLTQPKEPRVLRLMPRDHHSEKQPPLNLELRLPDNKIPKERTLSVSKSAVSLMDPNEKRVWMFPRNALEKPVGVLLSLDWDPWGFVVRKDRFFTTLMAKAAKILYEPPLNDKKFWGALEVSMMPTEGFRHDVDTVFSARALADRMVLDEALSTCLKGSGVLPLKLSLGVLFVLDYEFQTEVIRMVSRLALRTDRARVEEARKKAKEKEAVLFANLELIQKEHASAKARYERESAEKERYEKERSEKRAENSVQQTGADSSVKTGSDDGDWESADDSSTGGKSWAEDPVIESPQGTIIDGTRVDEETLKAFGVVYEQNQGSFLIKRRVPEWEQEIFRLHMQTRRQLRDVRVDSFATESLEYDFSSKELTWRKDIVSGEGEKASSWSLEGELLRVSETEKERVELEGKEVLLVCLWVANRAAMWIGSLDSKPLLRFVEELDPHVYVV
ncbi:uncharacterized protein DNG_03165 [Cephalotrichum gorgonifer]|uniref:Uncharacterized protein n=1 Tax=Cephalotrichum gorgonifer TaxID=2041049 RepID=A0AAE8STB2_9PEZI|nr:uncharacterized protein DNG_03165 [Cephalotrichum gorgonifer]